MSFLSAFFLNARSTPLPRSHEDIASSRLPSPAGTSGQVLISTNQVWNITFQRVNHGVSGKTLNSRLLTKASSSDACNAKRQYTNGLERLPRFHEVNYWSAKQACTDPGVSEDKQSNGAQKSTVVCHLHVPSLPIKSTICRVTRCPSLTETIYFLLNLEPLRVISFPISISTNRTILPSFSHHHNSH